MRKEFPTIQTNRWNAAQCQAGCHLCHPPPRILTDNPVIGSTCETLPWHSQTECLLVDVPRLWIFFLFPCHSRTAGTTYKFWFIHWVNYTCFVGKWTSPLWHIRLMAGGIISPVTYIPDGNDTTNTLPLSHNNRRWWDGSRRIFQGLETICNFQLQLLKFAGRVSLRDSHWVFSDIGFWSEVITVTSTRIW